MFLSAPTPMCAILRTAPSGSRLRTPTARPACVAESRGDLQGFKIGSRSSCARATCGPGDRAHIGYTAELSHSHKSHWRIRRCQAARRDWARARQLARASAASWASLPLSGRVVNSSRADSMAASCSTRWRLPSRSPASMRAAAAAAALLLAFSTTLAGKRAYSATWMPKDLSDEPSLTWGCARGWGRRVRVRVVWMRVGVGWYYCREALGIQVHANWKGCTSLPCPSGKTPTPPPNT